MLSGSDTSDETVVGSRKRKVRKHAWKKVMAKSRRNLGKEYVSDKSGKMWAARKIRGPCSCANKCYDKVPEDVRKEIHENFWKLGDYEKQNAYLGKLLKSIPVKRRRKSSGDAKRFRRHSVGYCLINGNEEISVCKTAFLNIFDLREKRVRNVLEKQTSTGTQKPDMRGRRAPVNKISDERVKSVREHIALLPKVSSHYTRAKSPHRKYLTQELSIQKLHVLYQDYMSETHPDVIPVSKSKYTNIFNEEFNIGFAPSKTDTCNTCDCLQANIKHYDSNPNPSVPLHELKETLEQHEKLANEGLALLAELSAKYKDDEEVLACCFDLQQTLPTPKLSTGIAYYKRKLWTYNFGVYNLKTKKSTMYVWDEVTARRGSIEIASALCQWIEENHQDETRLILFSDNCPGQNKNRNMVLTLLRLLHQGKFFRIEHYFLVPGHSYMSCDRQFGNIILELRKRDNIETMDDYIRIIKTAVKSGINVVSLKQESFLDYSVLQNSITKTRKSKELKFSDARVVFYDVKFREGYSMKEDYEDDSQEYKVRLMPGCKAFTRELFNLGTVVIPRKYHAPIPLTQEKIADLKSLLPYVHPSYKADYFRNIIRAQESQELAGPPDEDEEYAADNVLDYDS